MSGMNFLAVDLFSGDRVTSFADAYAAGVRLIIHKATEGASVQDKTYAARRIDAKAAGLMWSAYHFLRHTPVDDQIANFFSVAQPEADTRLVLDWETADATTAIAREFLTKLDAKTGRKTILYSYASFLQEHLGSIADAFFGSHPLWLAAYRDTPPKPQVSWDRMLLWQYTEKARIPGLPGTPTGVDASHFDGDEVELRAAWLGLPSLTDPPFSLPPGDPAIAFMKAVQAQLADLGYPPGPIDGIEGPKTQEAISKFKVNNAELLAQLAKEHQ